jgi:hypothetical protein
VYHNISLSTGLPAQTLMGISINDCGPEPVPEPAPVALVLCGAGFVIAVRLRPARSEKS